MHDVHPHPNLLLLVIAAVVVIWLLRKSWKDDPLEGEDWCFLLYLLAAVLLVISFLPPPDMTSAGRSGSLTPARLSLILGLAALVVGGLLHVRLARRGRLIPWERRRVYLGGVVLVAAMAVAYALAERAGVGWTLHLWIGLGFVALIFLLVALWVLPQILRLWFAPGQRIARFLRDNRPEEAVRVGEAVPSDRRDPQTEWNLAVAYEAVGRKDDAEALWVRLGERTDLPESMVAVLQQRAAGEAPQAAGSEGEPGWREGVIRADTGELIARPGLTLREIMAGPLGASATVTERGPYRSVTLWPVAIGGHECWVQCDCEAEAVHGVSLGVTEATAERLGFETGFASRHDGPEVAFLEDWVCGETGKKPPAQFPWGEVLGVYDAIAGFARIRFAYRPPQAQLVR